VLSGTPTAPGNYEIAMILFDGVDHQYEQYNLNVYAVEITTPGLLPNGTQGQSYSTSLSANGGTGGYTYNIISGGLPNGLTLAANGSITGTLMTGPGLYGFGVKVTDADGASSSKLMSLDVVGSPATPMRINSVSFNDPVYGDHYGGVGSVCCGGTAPFTWTVTGLPPGMTTEPNSNSFTQYPSNPGGVQIYGIPEATGTFQVQFTVMDATGATTSVTVPMHVSILDVAIGNTGNGFNLPNGTISVPYTTEFHVLGGTAAYSAVETGNGALPDGLALNSAKQTISGTPHENGSFFTQFEFSDKEHNTLTRGEGIFINGAASSTISINGNGYFGYYLGSTPVNKPYFNQFFACCAPSYTWSASVAKGSALPPGLSLSPTGQLTGTSTKSGTYNFLLEVASATNPANVGVKNFTLTVTPITITTNSLPAGQVGTAYTATLSATGGKGVLKWTQPYNQGSLLPPGLTLSTSGVISGTPTSPGSYSVILKTTDASGNTAIQGFGINVSE
jgi:hypothetical protein